MPAWTDNTPVGNPIERGWYGALMVLMAGTLIVFIRRNIGARILLRRDFIFLCVTLYGVCFYEDSFDRYFIAFAVVATILAFVHHFRHMRRIRRGFPEWHSFDTGRPWLLALVPLPRTLVQMLLEPVLCGFLGWWLITRPETPYGQGTVYLGWWILIASGFLFNLENRIRVARRNNLLDLGDTVIESIHYSQRAEKFAEGAGRAGAAAGRASIRPSDPWFYTVWKAVRAAQLAKRAKHDAAARSRRQQQEEAEARAKQQQGQHEQDADDAAANQWRDPTAGRMTQEQALEILELKSGASASEIRAAYNRLMQKVHPDAGGSTFFAKQLNLARDTLLKPQRKSG
jgi:hypothetical protein